MARSYHQNSPFNLSGRQDRTGEVHTRRKRWKMLRLLQVAFLRQKSCQSWYVRHRFQLRLALSVNSDRLHPTLADTIRTAPLQICSQTEEWRVDASSQYVQTSCKHEVKGLDTKFPEHARHLTQDLMNTTQVNNTHHASEGLTAPFDTGTQIAHLRHIPHHKDESRGFLKFFSLCEEPSNHIEHAEGSDLILIRLSIPIYEFISLVVKLASRCVVKKLILKVSWRKLNATTHRQSQATGCQLWPRKCHG
eukprot:IDg14513t1